jgi:hypothetical protein
MKIWHRKRTGIFIIIVLSTALAVAQSLGDAARQNQVQKQKDKAVKPTAKKVYTDADMPSAASGASAAEAGTGDKEKTDASGATASGGSGEAKWTAEQWKSAIGGMKERITDIQQALDEALKNQRPMVSGGGRVYCYVNNQLVSCEEYNQAVKSNQDAIAHDRSQLEEAKQKLADTQEHCRKAGFGNSVYD